MNPDQILDELARTIKSAGPKQFVYVLVHGQREEIVKVGFSSNPKARARGLQETNPELDLLMYFRGTRKTESTLHCAFRGARIYKTSHREWFRIKGDNTQQTFIALTIGCAYLSHTLDPNSVRFRSDLKKPFEQFCERLQNYGQNNEQNDGEVYKSE